MPIKKDKKKSKAKSKPKSTINKSGKVTQTVNVYVSKKGRTTSTAPKPKVQQIIYQSQPQLQPQIQSQPKIEASEPKFSIQDYIALLNSQKKTTIVEPPKPLPKKNKYEPNEAEDLQHSYDYQKSLKEDKYNVKEKIDTYPVAEAEYSYGYNNPYDTLSEVSLPKRRGRPPKAVTADELEQKRLEKNAKQREAYAQRKERINQIVETLKAKKEQEVAIAPVINLNPNPITNKKPTKKKPKPDLIFEEDFGEADLGNK